MTVKHYEVFVIKNALEDEIECVFCSKNSETAKIYLFGWIKSAHEEVTRKRILYKVGKIDKHCNITLETRPIYICSELSLSYNITEKDQYQRSFEKAMKYTDTETQLNLLFGEKKI